MWLRSAFDPGYIPRKSPQAPFGVVLQGSDHKHIILLFFVNVSLNLFVGQTSFGKRVIKETCEAPENPHQEEEQIPFKEKIPD